MPAPAAGAQEKFLRGDATWQTIASVATKAYITETWVSGKSWYRKWSDGWIEQGGKITLSGQKNYTITFLKPYSTTNYHVGLQHFGAQVSLTYTNAFPVLSVTTENFVTWSPFTESGRSMLWQTCGY